MAFHKLNLWTSLLSLEDQPPSTFLYLTAIIFLQKLSCIYANLQSHLCAKSLLGESRLLIPKATKFLILTHNSPLPSQQKSLWGPHLIQILSSKVTMVQLFKSKLNPTPPPSKRKKKKKQKHTSYNWTLHVKLWTMEGGRAYLQGWLLFKSVKYSLCCFFFLYSFFHFWCSILFPFIFSKCYSAICNISSMQMQ